MSDYQTMGSISEGTDVYGSDGEKVGSIVAVRPNYLVVEKGFFFPTDYYIPVSSVASVEEGRVHLAVTKDAALNQGWDAVPADYDSEAVVTTTETVGSYSTDNTMASTGTGVGDAIGTTAGSGAALVGSGWDDTTARTERTIDETALRTDRTVDAGETISVPVREESLSATKTARELGEVRIEKDVVAEERTLSVPVTEERVRVERRAVDRPATSADAGAFQDETIEVPVYGEDVQLQKSVRVAEEVEIGKEAVQREQQVTGTVRREEVRVTDTVETGADGVVGEGAAVIDPGADIGGTSRSSR